MKILVDGKEVEIAGSKVSDMFEELGMNPEIFLVKRNDEIIHEYELLKENDKIELIKVISGG
jgi:thiamine biosynthesis protein ThiS